MSFGGGLVSALAAEIFLGKLRAVDVGVDRVLIRTGTPCKSSNQDKCKGWICHPPADER